MLALQFEQPLLLASSQAATRRRIVRFARQRSKWLLSGDRSQQLNSNRMRPVPTRQPCERRDGLALVEDVLRTITAICLFSRQAKSD